MALRAQKSADMPSFLIHRAAQGPKRKKRRTTILVVPTQKKTTVALGMPREEAREAFRRHTARLRAIKNASPQKNKKKLDIAGNQITQYFTSRTNDTKNTVERRQRNKKGDSICEGAKGKVTSLQVREATKVAEKVAYIAAYYAMDAATTVANTLATLAAIACAGYAIRIAELAENQIINTAIRQTRQNKRKPGIDITKNDGESDRVTATKKSGTGVDKKTKLTPVHACAIARVCCTPPAPTTLLPAATYTFSTGRGSKHCRDYAIADRKGKKKKRGDSN